MFRDEAQTPAAIRRLLATVYRDVDRWWTDKGPTEAAVRVVTERDGPLSAGEVLMVFVAFDVWTGGGGATLSRVLAVLGNEPLAALGSLMVAIARGPEAIDAWTAQQPASAHASTRG